MTAHCVTARLVVSCGRRDGDKYIRNIGKLIYDDLTRSGVIPDSACGRHLDLGAHLTERHGTSLFGNGIVHGNTFYKLAPYALYFNCI